MIYITLFILNNYYLYIYISNMNYTHYKVLKCPITQQSMSYIQEPEINNFNIYNPSIKKAFITTDNKILYPFVDDIIFMLPEYAQYTNEYINEENDITKSDSLLLVQSYYNNNGWKSDINGVYNDAKTFEDLRKDISFDYINKCHERLGENLNIEGEYMLDGGCGATQFDQYIKYSDNYKYRICVDISLEALLESKKKIKEKGIYILGDLTKLPIKDNVVDSFTSINVIYHIDKDKQIEAIKELYRTLKTNGKGVIVYDWYKYSKWMNIALLPFRGITFFKNKLVKIYNKLNYKVPNLNNKTDLYFHAHNYNYINSKLIENNINYKLGCWRSISVPFMKIYLHGKIGKYLLSKIYKFEDNNQYYCGLNGEYPMFIFIK